MTIRQIRKTLRARFGARRYRITSHGKEIHVYGILPASNIMGWYFFGFLGEKMTEEWLQEL